MDNEMLINILAATGAIIILVLAQYASNSNNMVINDEHRK